MRLKNIHLEGTDQELSNVVLIVGPNNTGKTTFLRDLYDQAVRSNRSSISTSDSMRWRPLFNGSFFEATVSDYFKYHDKATSIPGITPEAYANLDLWHRDISHRLSSDQYHNLGLYKEGRFPSDPGQLEEEFGPSLKEDAFCSLWIDRRFEFASNNFGDMYERHGQNMNVPSYLAYHPEIVDRLNRWLRRIFDKQIFVEPHLYPQVEVLIGPAGTPRLRAKPATFKNFSKSKTAYNTWRESEKLVQPVQEGHGTRAALQVLFCLADSQKQVYFIDEPESHLYPEVSRKVASIVAEESRTKQFFIVTHDVDFIEGIMHGAQSLDVIRIDSNRNLRMVKIGAEKLKSLRSSKRNIDALRTIFHDYTIFVEGVKDKFVYEGAINISHLLDDKAFVTVACNGNDRIAELSGVASMLDIKRVVITDFDTITADKNGNPTLAPILKTLCADTDVVTDILANLSIVRAGLKGIPNVNKMGLGAIGDPIIRQRVIDFIADCKVLGLFIVPNGALESWFGVTKEEVEVEDLLPRYRAASKRKYRNLKNFLEEIALFLNAR